MSLSQNTPSTFLRTQSYIVNGEPNPNLLSKISRKKYFTNFIKIYNKNKTKAKISLTNKQYISEIKKHKKKKSCSLIKYDRKRFIKHKIINPPTENKQCAKEEEIKKIKEINSNIALNKTVKNKEKVSNIKNKFKNENSKNIEFSIDKIYKDNKFSDRLNNMSIYSINTFTNKNYNIKKAFNKKCNFTNLALENEKNCHKDDILNIIYDNKIFSNTTKYNYNSKYKDFEHNKIINFNLSNSRKSTKNKKKCFSLQKDKSFINKMLLKEDTTDIDEYINKIKNKNKLLDKFNYYTRRENVIQNSDYIQENRTKEKIKSMKRSINKISININPDINSKDKYQGTKFNEFKKNNNYLNFYNKSIKNNIKFINSLNKASLYYKRNNDMSPMLTDYNLNNDKELFKPKIFKESIKRTFSNALFAMRDERHTNKFIKELNKNNRNYNSNKVIPFSFNKDESENFDNEFIYSLKKNTNSHINTLLIEDKGNKTMKFSKNSDYNRNKTNKFIKKNCSFDNFRKHSKREYFQSNFNIVNNKLFNFMNGDINNNSIVIMPANQAD